MSLRTIIREIERTLTPWEKIGDSNNFIHVPLWIINAIKRYEQKLYKNQNLHGIDFIKYFKGKTFVYKVVSKCLVQGQETCGHKEFYRKPLVK